MSAERYRTADLSADDVLILRELTAIADELTEPGAGMRTVVLSPARSPRGRGALRERTARNGFARKTASRSSTCAG